MHYSRLPQNPASLSGYRKIRGYVRSPNLTACDKKCQHLDLLHALTFCYLKVLHVNEHRCKMSSVVVRQVLSLTLNFGCVNIYNGHLMYHKVNVKTSGSIQEQHKTGMQVVFPRITVCHIPSFEIRCNFLHYQYSVSEIDLSYIYYFESCFLELKIPIMYWSRPFHIFWCIMSTTFYVLVLLTVKPLILVAL